MTVVIFIRNKYLNNNDTSNFKNVNVLCVLQGNIYIYGGWFSC